MAALVRKRFPDTHRVKVNCTFGNELSFVNVVCILQAVYFQSFTLCLDQEFGEGKQKEMEKLVEI